MIGRAHGAGIWRHDVRSTRLIILAAAAAVTAAVLVNGLQQFLMGREADAPRGLAGRLVVATDLSAGHRLTETDVSPNPSWKATPEEIAALTRAVVGRPLARGLIKGQVLQDSDLAARGSGAALVGEIPPGSRAITVMLREAGPGVVLFPGATVDVLATVEVPARGGAAKETVTRVIVEGVRVLAVNTDAPSKTEEATERRSLPRRLTVTLLTSPTQANQIELASTKGMIGLTLRPEGDPNPAGVASATTQSLVGVNATRTEMAAPSTSASAAPPPAAATGGPPPPPVWEVTVVKGDESVRHTFPADSSKVSGRSAGPGGSPR